MGAIVSGGSSTRSSTCAASSAASASSFMRCFSSASAGFGGTSPVIAATSSANLESDGFGGAPGDPSSSSFDDDPGVSSSLADASAHTRLLTRHLAASTDTPRHEDGAHRLGRQATAAIRPTAVDLTARDSVMRGNASRCLRPSRGFRPPTAGALLAAHPDCQGVRRGCVGAHSSLNATLGGVDGHTPARGRRPPVGQASDRGNSPHRRRSNCAGLGDARQRVALSSSQPWVPSTDRRRTPRRTP